MDRLKSVMQWIDDLEQVRWDRRLTDFERSLLRDYETEADLLYSRLEVLAEGIGCLVPIGRLLVLDW
jgi:hypothetical protein